MDKIFKFTFPFTGKVKTQLIISNNRLVKPKHVKNFENHVRRILAHSFPIEMRPIRGHLKFDMYHFTTYKRDNDGLLVPTTKGDLDNLFKALADCFEPLKKKVAVIENGEPTLNDKGKPKYRFEEISPGVIKNDKYITNGTQRWIPVHSKDEEKIEVYISVVDETSLFELPHYDEEKVKEFPI